MFHKVILASFVSVDQLHYSWSNLARNSQALADIAERMAQEATPRRSAAAMPDVPSSVGWALFAAYLSLVGSLALATLGPGKSTFTVVIAGLFVVAFFAVPAFIFAQEPKDGPHPTMEHFLVTGINTYTGHCTGAAAVLQMFIVPVALTAGVLLMAVEIALVR